MESGHHDGGPALRDRRYKGRIKSQVKGARLKAAATNSKPGWGCVGAAGIILARGLLAPGIPARWGLGLLVLPGGCRRRLARRPGGCGRLDVRAPGART